MIGFIGTSFFEGGVPFNVATLFATVIGTVLTLIGLIIAFSQIRKTRAAAEAARDAATQTLQRLQNLGTVVDLSKALVVSKEILVLLDEHNVVGASLRAGDLRDRIVELRGSASGQRLLPQKKWQELVTSVKTAREALDEIDAQANSDSGLLRPIRRQMDSVHERLLALASEQVAGWENINA